MTRMFKDAPVLKPVDEYEVAPHRYTWDANVDYYNLPKLSEFLKAVPYQPGDVVYYNHDGEARKAYVHIVVWDYDRCGFRIEKFKIMVANKDGKTFAKNWRYAYAGQIQRGYMLAGLAPDIPE